MSKRELPKHINMTMREWRKDKRGALKCAKYWIDECRFGSAYVPFAYEIWQCKTLIDQAIKKASVKEWGK